MKVWVLIFWDGDGSKEGQEGQEQCDMWEFPERGICSLWSTALPPGRFYIRIRLKSPLRVYITIYLLFGGIFHVEAQH